MHMRLRSENQLLLTEINNLKSQLESQCEQLVQSLVVRNDKNNIIDINETIKDAVCMLLFDFKSDVLVIGNKSP